jgi:hypothetical protein
MLSFLIVFTSRSVFADDDSDLTLRAEVHHKKAKELILDKDFEGARTEILGAIDLEPNVGEYWRILGGLDEYLDAHYEENLKAWRKYLKLVPDTPKKEDIEEKIADLENKLDSEKKVEKSKEESAAENEAGARDYHIMHASGIYFNYINNPFGSTVFKFSGTGVYTDPNYSDDTWTSTGSMSVTLSNSYEIQFGGSFKFQNPFIDYLFGLDLLHGSGNGSVTYGSNNYSVTGPIDLYALQLMNGLDFTLNKPSDLGGVFQFHIPIEVGFGLMWTQQQLVVMSIAGQSSYYDDSGTLVTVYPFNDDPDLFLSGDAGLGVRLWFADFACLDVIEEYQSYWIPDSSGFFQANTNVSYSTESPANLSGFKTKFQIKFAP